MLEIHKETVFLIFCKHLRGTVYRVKGRRENEGGGRTIVCVKKYLISDMQRKL